MSPVTLRDAGLVVIRISDTQPRSSERTAQRILGGARILEMRT